jgi:uracil-DNA glycosylase
MNGVRVYRTMNLTELRSRMEACRACSLYSSGVLVGARFGPNAEVGDIDLLVVGEAPDQEASMTGVPFGGRLRSTLDGWLRRTCPNGKFVIVNVMKHRPVKPDGSDRYPSAQEIAACLPWLGAQVAVLRPRQILGLGTAAFVAMTGDAESDFETAVRSQRTWSFQGVVCYFYYHPGAVLANPQILWEEGLDTLARARSSVE